jgi:putative endonuclease
MDRHVTKNLLGRVWEHRNGFGGKFTTKYHCSRLVYYEVFRDSYTAITREKQIKAERRKAKEALISAANPEWNDLYETCVGGDEIATGPAAPRNDRGRLRSPQ